MEFRTMVAEETARRYKREGWWAERSLLDDFDAAVAATRQAA
jgi:hypothetical protein